MFQKVDIGGDILYRAYYSNELYHYGVKGMKWGVRRDYRVLANRRRNEAVRKVKTDYKTGVISRSEKKQRMKEAKNTKKILQTQMKSRYKNAKTREERKALNQDIRNQTIREVPHRRIKKGATTVNRLLTVGTVGSAAIGTVAAVATAPALAPLALTSLAGTTALNAGRQALFQWGIDRLT